MAIYGIGSHFGGIGNVADKFIADGVAGSNWEVADAPDIHQIIISLKVGDIIFIKQAEQAKLTQESILAKCMADGLVKVTVTDMKNAFPSLISQIDGNAFRTQIDNKQFHEFLLKNNLTFSLPDFVFKKQI